jgi:hypothetical protein
MGRIRDTPSGKGSLGELSGGYNARLRKIPSLYLLLYLCTLNVDDMKNLLGPLLEELKNQIVKEVLFQLKNEIQSPNKKLFYSLAEVSEITGLTKTSIKGRYKRGTLKVVYSGIKPLIPASELEIFLNRLGGQHRNAA